MIICKGALMVKRQLQVEDVNLAFLVVLERKLLDFSTLFVDLALCYLLDSLFLSMRPLDLLAVFKDLQHFAFFLLLLLQFNVSFH